MSSIIKSTPESIQAIGQMQAIINGRLRDEVQALANAGDTAGDPVNWEGPLAQRFRGDWGGTKANLSRLLIDLEELRVQLSAVQANIQMAGGAA